jgi:hypothetical protein
MNDAKPNCDTASVLSMSDADDGSVAAASNKRRRVPRSESQDKADEKKKGTDKVQKFHDGGGGVKMVEYQALKDIGSKLNLAVTHVNTNTPHHFANPDNGPTETVPPPANMATFALAYALYQAFAKAMGFQYLTECVIGGNTFLRVSVSHFRLQQLSGSFFFPFMCREVLEREMQIRREQAKIWVEWMIAFRARWFVRGQEAHDVKKHLKMTGPNLRGEFNACMAPSLRQILLRFVDTKLLLVRDRWENHLAGVMAPPFADCATSTAPYSGYVPLPPMPANDLDGAGTSWFDNGNILDNYE